MSHHPLACLVLARMLAPAAAQDEPIFVAPWTAADPGFLIAAGDLNDDGLGDVALVSQPFLYELTVRLGQADGSLLLTSTVQFGSAPSALEVADFDGDSGLDVLCDVEGDLRVYQVSRDGALIPGPTTSVTWLSLAAVKDFNLDGGPDVLVTGWVPSVGWLAQVLLNQGDGSFAVATEFPTAASPEVAVGELNDDGFPDITVSDFYPGKLATLLGDGTGGFAGLPPTDMGLVIESIAMLDLTDDGRDELLVSDNVSMSLFRNLGHVDFAPAEVLPEDHGHIMRVLADFDEDGRTDVVAGDTEWLVVNLNDGDGGLAISQVTSVLQNYDLPVVTCDMNGDGDLDLLAAPGEITDPRVSVVHGLGDGRFAEFLGSHPAPSKLARVHLTDLDEDGRDDFVLGFEYLQTNVCLAGFGGACGPVHASFGGPSAMEVLDANGDGHIDLFSPGDSVNVRLGDGQAGFGDVIVSGFFAGDLFDKGDIDGDGLIDLMSEAKSSTWFNALLSKGDGHFKPVTTLIVAPTTGTAHALADLDGDGWPDFARGVQQPGATENGLIVYPGFGTGEFAAGNGSQPGLYLRALDAADVDLDGAVDLVALLNASDDLHILPNDGSGGFGAAQLPYATGVDGPSQLRLADFTGDGLTDVFLDGYYDQLGAIVAGTPGGQFVPESPFELLESEDVAVGDIDGDGWPDLVIAQYLDTRCLVLLNQHGPWNDHGQALAGSRGKPRQIGFGKAVSGSPINVALHDGARLSPAFQVIGLSSVFTPFRGGVLVPQPDLVNGPHLTDAQGELLLGGTVPSMLSSGATLWMQTWLVDAAGPAGWSASNALSFTLP